MSSEISSDRQRFLDWLPTAEPMGGVESMLRQYRDWLEENGAAEADASAAIGDVLRFLKERDDAWAPLFDRIYTSAAPEYRTRPNGLLVEVATARGPGRALDVCTGEGRNSVWLAQQGWQVTAFDVSAEGIAAARRRAAEAGVTPTFVQQSADDFDYASEAWDLVAVFYAPVPLTEPGFIARLSGAMAPGAVIVVESFASEQGGRLRKPVDIDPDVLRDAFAGFAIQRLDDVIDRPDWTDAPARLVRMIAEKRESVTADGG